MISYETYMTVSFNLGAGKASTNFIRSQFDYGTRQRRAVRGFDTFGVRFCLTQTQMDEWTTFWDALNDGNDKFTTDEVINSDVTTGKIARFTSGYDVSQIGANKFIITVPLELIQTGV